MNKKIYYSSLTAVILCSFFPMFIVACYFTFLPWNMNRLNIDESDPSAPIFTIESPLDSEDNELRYGIFRYKPGKKESIVGGVKSWAGE